MHPYLSIIVPVYNEAENVAALQERIVEKLHDVAQAYEVIYVDDGSRDDSFAILRKLAASDARMKLIQFRKNYGQTAAMAAAIDAAQGEIIIPLDADLQNDPQDIPRLLEKIAEGYDVVSGWRKARQDTFITRKLPSLLANRLISLVTGIYLHDYGCSLKAYRADLLKSVRLYGEMHRFIPAFCMLEGARVTELVVTHHPRRAGKSKYGLSRTFKVILDLMVVKFLSSYAKRPIHAFGALAFISSLLALSSGVIALYEKLFLPTYNSGLFFLLAVLLFIFGLQLVMMGLLAEVMMRTYYESQGKKIYTIARTVNIMPELNEVDSLQLSAPHQ